MYKPNEELTPTGKRRIAIVVVLLAAAVVGASSVLYHEEQTLDAEITVVEGTDPNNVHRATTLTVVVENEHSTPIQPAFQASHEVLSTHFYWEIVSGPETLKPGESAVYRVRAPVVAAGIPFQTKALLVLNDEGRDLQTRTAFELPKREPPTILNPLMKYWLHRLGTTHRHPYRWQVAGTTTGAETRDVSAGPRGQGAVVSVTNATREKGPWTMAGLLQQAAFPARFHVEATPRTVAQNVSEHPPVVTGVEIGETNHRVWIVFANVSQRQVVYRGGDLSYIFVYVPANPGERVEATVNVEQLYERYGWELPARQQWTIDGVQYQRRPVHVLGFAAVYPGAERDNASVVFHEISGTRLNESEALNRTDDGAGREG